jgi:hypothetical protein
MNNACTAAIYLVAYAQQIVAGGLVLDGVDSALSQYKRLVDAAKISTQA